MIQETSMCTFNDCHKPALAGSHKCFFHKNRSQCYINGCSNQVYARKLCVRHGGKKNCLHEGCESHARSGGYCLQHGGFVVKRFCNVEGCSKQAHARQKCVRHGGGRQCRVPQCTHHARAGGYCNRHFSVSANANFKAVEKPAIVPISVKKEPALMDIPEATAPLREQSSPSYLDQFQLSKPHFSMDTNLSGHVQEPFQSNSYNNIYVGVDFQPEPFLLDNFPSSLHNPEWNNDDLSSILGTLDAYTTDLMYASQAEFFLDDATISTSPLNNYADCQVDDSVYSNAAIDITSSLDFDFVMHAPSVCVPSTLDSSFWEADFVAIEAYTTKL